MKILSNTVVTSEDRSLNDYQYQINLTKKLTDFSGDFTQEVINELVLWKVNRYCKIPIEAQSLLNEIGKEDRDLNGDKTKIIP